MCLALSRWLGLREQTVQQPGMKLSGRKVRVMQDTPEESEVRLDTADEVLIERPQHARDRLLARGGVGDELGEHGIVVERYRPAFVHAHVLTNAGAGGCDQPRDGAGRGKEVVVRILGIHTAFQRMSAELYVGLSEGELLPRGHAKLQLHQVQAGDHLGDRVLHLQPGVHLQKVEVPVGVHQELDCAGVGVAGRFRDPHGRLAHLATHGLVHDGRGRLFDDLLVAALHRALTLAEVDHVAVLIAEYLHLHVPRLQDRLLDVDLAIAEGAQRFTAGGVVGIAEVRRALHQAHPLAPAAGCSLQHHRITDFRGDLLRFFQSKAA